ncbi:glycosyltransferase family 9 protein [bacterium]|nr:glycosyltransferase family 9 protein [bacterium]
MKTNTMRNIDFFLGRPLCFLLSFVYRAQDSGTVEKNIDNPKKILFIKLSEMGSMVLLHPAIKNLQKNFPKAELFFLTFKENVGCVELLNITKKHNCFTIRNESFFSFFVDNIIVLYKIRKLKIDIVFDLEVFAKYSLLFSLFIKAKAITGFYDSTRHNNFCNCFFSNGTVYDQSGHISENYSKLLKSIKKNTIDTEQKIILPKIYSQINDKKNIWDKLKENNSLIKEDKNIILLNPNASDKIAIRKWPIDYFLELTELLLLHTDSFIVIIGTADDAHEARVIKDNLKNDRIIDFTKKTTLREYVDLCNISKMLISNDSGPAHFAALTDIRILVIFGPETPDTFRPLSENLSVFYSNYKCSPCVSPYNQKRTYCKQADCLKAITVSQVYSEAVKYL